MTVVIELDSSLSSPFILPVDRRRYQPTREELHRASTAGDVWFTERWSPGQYQLIKAIDSYPVGYDVIQRRFTMEVLCPDKPPIFKPRTTHWKISDPEGNAIPMSPYGFFWRLGQSGKIDLYQWVLAEFYRELPMASAYVEHYVFIGACEAHQKEMMLWLIQRWTLPVEFMKNVCWYYRHRDLSLDLQRS